MKVNSLMSGINIKKKQSWIGLFQDIYTLVYCMIIIPLSMYNLIYNTNIIDWKINLFSYVYFIITGLINLYYWELNFVLHHIICIGLIWTGNNNSNIEYHLWISKCYLAEISNIFLSGKNILGYFRIKGYIQNKIYENVNDALFVLSYFIVRIFLLIPYSFVHLYFNYCNGLIYEYFNFIFINVFMMTLLNIYWCWLIIKKIIKLLNKKKDE